MTEKFNEEQHNFNSNIAYTVGLYKGTLDQIITIAQNGDQSSLACILIKAKQSLELGEKIWQERYDKHYTEIIK
jgi:hypothetical protein